MFARIAFYQNAFAHEVSANHAMLDMLEGVPVEAQTDPHFQRAVNLASHMTACRTNFLALFQGAESAPEPWFEEQADIGALRKRYESMEAGWTAYLDGLTEATLGGDFEFVDDGQRWRLNLEAQVFQLLGHAAYHRGQVVMLVDQLGGETWDTDYIEWFTDNHPDKWSALG